MPREVRNLEALQTLIDEYGLRTVLEMVADICTTKAVMVGPGRWTNRAKLIRKMASGLNYDPTCIPDVEPEPNHQEETCTKKLKRTSKKRAKHSAKR